MTHQVEIIIKDGLIQDVKCLPGISAVVLDYDVKDFTENLDTDTNGNLCFRTTYNWRKSYSEMQETIKNQQRRITHLTELYERTLEIFDEIKTKVNTIKI